MRNLLVNPRVAQSLDPRSRGESAYSPYLQFSKIENAAQHKGYECATFLISVHHHPSWLQDRISNQSDHRGYADQERVADLPLEQDRQRHDADQRRQPVANRDLPE